MAQILMYLHTGGTGKGPTKINTPIVNAKRDHDGTEKASAVKLNIRFGN